MLLPRIERPVSKATDVGSIKLISSDGVVTNSDGTMVTIITEKLRSQTLDDNVQFAPITQTRRSWDLAPTRGSSRICHVKGEKDWSQYVQSSDHYRQPASTTNYDDLSQSASLPFPPGCPTACSSGDPRSHCQPSTPQKAAPPPAIATQLPPLTTASVTTTQQMMVVGRGIGLGGEGGTTTSLSSKTPPLMGFYNKSLTSCGQSEFIPGTPPDPPKKRHCRSLSIPGDVKTIKCSNKSSTWQPQASSIWKPVALRPHRKPHHSGSGIIKTRNSPISFHSKPPKLLSSSPNNLSKGNLIIGHNGAVNQNHPLCPSQPNFSPTVHVFTGNDATNIVTPPESPAPRPASASSGFYDSSASQTSLTSLNVSWTEGYFNQGQGCFSPHPPRSTSASSNQSFQRRSDSFHWVRSLSVEEPISLGEQTLRPNSNKVSRPNNQDRNRGFESSPRATRSMPVINLSVNSTPRLTPWSPRRHRVPRCRSQPCVLTERKAGLKRRRDEERPSINFKKMAETAYPPSVHQNRPKSVTFAQDIQESHSTRSGMMYNELESYHVLDPIASSPLDPPHQGFTQMAAQVLQGNRENGGTTNVSSTYVSRDKITKPSSRLVPSAGSGSTLKVPIVAGALKHCEGMAVTTTSITQNCGQTIQRGVEEIQWDSGCSDTNDPPDLISFSESSENSYSFNDEPPIIARDVETLEESQQQFELEMGIELDLDQIEKD